MEFGFALAGVRGLKLKPEPQDPKPYPLGPES